MTLSIFLCETLHRFVTKKNLVVLKNLLTEAVIIVNEFNRIFGYFAGINTNRIKVCNMMAPNLFCAYRSRQTDFYFKKIIKQTNKF